MLKLQLSFGQRSTDKSVCALTAPLSNAAADIVKEPPEVARTVAGGPSVASDHRKFATYFSSTPAGVADVSAA
jgi:hypothetical protein